MSLTYTVFKRSATNWSEFSKSRKYVQIRGVSLDTARRMCKEFNENRTKRQIQRGTVMEFTSE